MGALKTIGTVRTRLPELFATERDQLMGVVDLYRYDPTTHSEVVPILGNKGAGKTHLLHSIKHGTEGAWQLLVTPGTYQKDTDFMEYLLFQTIDTLLGGGKQKGRRPLEFVSEQLTRGLLHRALCSASTSSSVWKPSDLSASAKFLNPRSDASAGACSPCPLLK